MKSLVLERKKQVALRDFALDEHLTEQDVRVEMATVGICGSDIHYYLHGAIGSFVVTQPMILGHEGSGTVVETGRAVKHLKVGDRVCMEPGIPDPLSRAARLGRYNLDPAVRFWATPPVHGCLRPSVVHPAAYTFQLPENVSLAEGAMAEPLAVAVHAAAKARVRPGDVAVVIGAGPIGLLTAQASIAAGCSRVVVSDIQPGKLAIAAGLPNVLPVDVRHASLREAVNSVTEGIGADLVFECSGHRDAATSCLELLAPGGTVVLIGMPEGPVAFDVVAAQIKEARVETVFRYAHVFPRALALLSSGRINVKALITNRFSFDEAVAAFEYAGSSPASAVKTLIDFQPSAA